MAGLWYPSKGKVLLDERNLHGLRRPEVARHITYVPQETRLDFDLSVIELQVLPL